MNRLLCVAALFLLTGCASLAPLFGVETAADTDRKVREIHAALDVFGPYGSIIASGIGAVLVGANHAYRNKTRKKAIAKAHQPAPPQA